MKKIDDYLKSDQKARQEKKHTIFKVGYYNVKKKDKNKSLGDYI